MLQGQDSFTHQKHDGGSESVPLLGAATGRVSSCCKADSVGSITRCSSLPPRMPQRNAYSPSNGSDTSLPVPEGPLAPHNRGTFPSLHGPPLSPQDTVLPREAAASHQSGSSLKPVASHGGSTTPGSLALGPSGGPAGHPRLPPVVGPIRHPSRSPARPTPSSRRDGAPLPALPALPAPMQPPQLPGETPPPAGAPPLPPLAGAGPAGSGGRVGPSGGIGRYRSLPPSASPASALSGCGMALGERGTAPAAAQQGAATATAAAASAPQKAAPPGSAAVGSPAAASPPTLTEQRQRSSGSSSSSSSSSSQGRGAGGWVGALASAGEWLQRVPSWLWGGADRGRVEEEARQGRRVHPLPQGGEGGGQEGAKDRVEEGEEWQEALEELESEATPAGAGGRSSSLGSWEARQMRAAPMPPHWDAADAFWVQGGVGLWADAQPLHAPLLLSADYATPPRRPIGCIELSAGEWAAAYPHCHKLQRERGDERKHEGGAVHAHQGVGLAAVQHLPAALAVVAGASSHTTSFAPAMAAAAAQSTPVASMLSAQHSLSATTRGRSGGSTSTSTGSKSGASHAKDQAQALSTVPTSPPSCSPLIPVSTPPALALPPAVQATNDLVRSIGENSSSSIDRSQATVRSTEEEERAGATLPLLDALQPASAELSTQLHGTPATPAASGHRKRAAPRRSALSSRTLNSEAERQPQRQGQGRQAQQERGKGRQRGGTKGRAGAGATHAADAGRQEAQHQHLVALPGAAAGGGGPPLWSSLPGAPPGAPLSSQAACSLLAAYTASALSLVSGSAAAAVATISSQVPLPALPRLQLQQQGDAAAAAAAATGWGQALLPPLECYPPVAVPCTPSPLSAAVGAVGRRLAGRAPRPMAGRKTLVLDLDETLVHSTFEASLRADFVLHLPTSGSCSGIISSSVSVISAGILPQAPPGAGVTSVYVHKRPGLHHFLAAVAELFEVVVFTASLPRYADPLLDVLDPGRQLIHQRLFRSACRPLGSGGYVKDLSALGRDLRSVILVDNSPLSYAWQPENGLAVSSFIDDEGDTELMRLLPLLKKLAHYKGDVRKVLGGKDSEPSRRRETGGEKAKQGSRLVEGRCVVTSTGSGSGEIALQM